MSTSLATGPAIADLVNLSAVIPDPTVAGFSEDFSALFCRADARLLRSTLSKGGVVVFRHKDLREMAANPAVGMAVEHAHFQRFYGNLVFTKNPPIHGPMRLVIARPLSPKHIPRLAQIAKQVASELLDEVVGQGEIDFGWQYSERFTARFWAALFEMTEDEAERLTEAVRAIGPAFLFDRTPEQVAAVTTAMDRYLELIANAIHRALMRGGNPLLEEMAVAFNAVHGETKPARLEEMIAANVFDGLHTTAVAGTNALYQLLLSPDDLTRVRENPSLVSNALAEGLRLWSPLIYTERYALTDLEFAGTLIPQGAAIGMLWAAGNRDPDVFTHPNRYDLVRGQQSETTFGGGIHICPGRHVVRMLTHTLLDAVLAPGVRIELTGPGPTWIAPSSARQLNRMQVTIRRVQC